MTHHETESEAQRFKKLKRHSGVSAIRLFACVGVCGWRRDAQIGCVRDSGWRRDSDVQIGLVKKIDMYRIW